MQSRCFCHQAVEFASGQSEMLLWKLWTTHCQCQTGHASRTWWVIHLQA